MAPAHARHHISGEQNRISRAACRLNNVLGQLYFEGDPAREFDFRAAFVEDASLRSTDERVVLRVDDVGYAQFDFVLRASDSGEARYPNRTAAMLAHCGAANEPPLPGLCTPGTLVKDYVFHPIVLYVLWAVQALVLWRVWRCCCTRSRTRRLKAE